VNCADFEEKLDQYHQGRLSLVERRAAGDHLESCSRCRRLVEVSEGEHEVLGSEALQDLANSILGRTSGSACNRACALLCDFVDGTLDPTYLSLLTTHLKHCSACKSLAGQLSELNQVLPELAEIDPGPGFLARVLRMTIRQPARIPIVWESVGKIWQHLVGRPRFSWEAAYAATLIFVILAGNPALSMGSAFFSRLGNTRMSPQEGLRAAVNALPPQWAETGNKTIQEAKMHASNILALKQQIPPVVNKLEQTSQQWTTSAARLKNQMHGALSPTWSKFAAKARHYLNPTKAAS
jgi:anti-sigma factor RsiW